MIAGVAQLEEHIFYTDVARGSNPFTRIFAAGMAQLEVRLPSKEKIAGSKPAARSDALVAQWIERLATNQELASSSLALGTNDRSSPEA